MEDPVEDAAKAKTTSIIGKLLAEFTGAIEDAHAHEVSQVLQQLRGSFSANGAQRSAVLQRFDDAASRLVHDFFSGVRLHLEIPVPDISAMLKSGTIKVSEREGAVRDAICDTRLVRKNERGITHIAPSVQHTLQQFNDDPKSQLSTLLELKNASEWLGLLSISTKKLI